MRVRKGAPWLKPVLVQCAWGAARSKAGCGKRRHVGTDLGQNNLRRNFQVLHDGRSLGRGEELGAMCPEIGVSQQAEAR
jgi:hypothetical protein